MFYQIVRKKKERDNQEGFWKALFTQGKLSIRFFKKRVYTMGATLHMGQRIHGFLKRLLDQKKKF